VFGRILDYASRFPQREMGIMLVSDMQRSIGKPLYHLPKFAEWANCVDDLVLSDALTET
jgi:hypothetical protein